MRKDDCDCLNHLNLRLLLYKMFIVVFHYVWQPTEIVFTPGL